MRDNIRFDQNTLPTVANDQTLLIVSLSSYPTNHKIGMC